MRPSSTAASRRTVFLAILSSTGAAVYDLHVHGELARERPRECRRCSLHDWQGENALCLRLLYGMGRRVSHRHSGVAARGRSEGVPMERVILPSHRRYLEYFSSVMGGVKPRPKPMFLKRVIVNSVPVFGSPEEADEGEACGCRPYLQIFKCGKLLFDSRSALDGSPGRFYSKSDLSFSFSVNCALQGDILVRCRHDAGKEGGGSASTTMFRASFHTGYIANLIQRLPRQQCDGARNNDKFDVDFFVDLIFDHSVEDSSSTLHGYEYDDIMDTGSAFWNTIGKRQERLRRLKKAGGVPVTSKALPKKALPKKALPKKALQSKRGGR